MKLLGTPTDRELQSMRAACTADDLPRLKPFPWDRIFATGTPPEAVDLAQRLLRYDPSQRLDAVQTLAHPFFARAPDLLSGAAGVGSDGAGTPQRGAGQPSSTAEWEQRLNRYYADLLARGSGIEQVHYI